jgi:hypothetical protein
MGTRAMILFEGKPVAATHWDGYPDDLGKGLMKAKPKNVSQILKVAAPHNIDWISGRYAPKKPLKIGKQTTYFARNDKEWNEISEKTGLHGSGANLEGTIKIGSAGGRYGDFAEYAYNVHADGTVEVAELSGEWTGRVPKRFTPVKDYLAKKKLGEVS